jgi:hypothetical protein
MATTNRPGAVTAMAIINMVLGGLGFAFWCCMGGVMGLSIGALVQAPAPKAGDPDIGGFFTNFNQKYPFLKVYLIICFAAVLLLTFLLFVSGFGLMKMRQWGRQLSLVIGVSVILLVCANVVFYFVVNLNAIQNDFYKEYGQLLNDVNKKNPGGSPPIQMPTIDPVVGAMMSILSALIYSAYPVILIWVMLLPKVRRAFAKTPGEVLPPAPEPEDYRDPPAIK